jgi:hypothetical protein
MVYHPTLKGIGGEISEYIITGVTFGKLVLGYVADHSTGPGPVIISKAHRFKVIGVVGGYSGCQSVLCIPQL